MIPFDFSRLTSSAATTTTNNKSNITSKSYQTRGKEIPQVSIDCDFKAHDNIKRTK
jgi:hypothetical protein